MGGFPWGQMATELWLTIVGLAMLVADILITDRRRKHLVAYLGIAGLLLAFVPASGSCAAQGADPTLFGGLYVTDRFQAFFRLFALVSSLLVFLLSLDYLEHIRLDRGVYFVLLMFGTLAMVFLAGSNDLVMIYLVIEFLSIVSYILAGFLLGSDKAEIAEIKRSSEASLKYLIYGAVASGVMLYGFSLMYGLAGSTAMSEIAKTYVTPGNELVKLLAVALAMVGFGFKISAVPFHQWAPDVYQGAPTPVSAFLAVGSKGAAFALLARFMILGLGGWQQHWGSLLGIMAVATMFTGNLLALLQSNFKRMLAYSSVAHAGYMLVALVCNDSQNSGVQAVLIYLMTYLLMTTGAFAVVIWYQRSTGSENIEEYAGLARREPAMAVALTVLLLSLTGIPPTAGFIGKFFILQTTVHAPQHGWLGLAIIVNSVISLYYYWNVVRLMWLREPAPGAPRLRPAVCSPAVVYLCAILTLLFGINFNALKSMSADPLKAFDAGTAAGAAVAATATAGTQSE